MQLSKSHRRASTLGSRAARPPILAAVLAFLVPASLAAQLVPIGPLNPLLADDTNFVQASLKEHTPRAVTGFRPNDGVSGHLLAVCGSGVAYKKFSSLSRSWSQWYYAANPTGIPTSDWDISLPVVRTSVGVGGNNTIDGFFGYVSGTSGRVGMPGAAEPPVVMDFGTQGTNGYFHAETDLQYMTGWGPEAVQKFRVFGNCAVDGDPDGVQNLDCPLLELNHNGVTWNQVDHGKPTDARSVLLGPQSAIAIYLQNTAQVRHMVFGTARYADTDKVAIRYWDGANWSWKDLGAPFAYTDIVSPPLVVHRYDNPATPPQVNVFIVARQKGSSTARFQLFEKYWNGSLTGNPSIGTETLSWGNWNNYGQPFDSATGGNLLKADKKYFMTSGRVWKQGLTLRVDLFGYAPYYEHPVTNAGTPGKLLRFYWNGGWGWDAAAGSPDNENIRTTSCFVIDEASYDRVSVIARSGAGRIYERYFECINGVEGSWSSKDLTKLELVRRFP